MMWQVIMIQKRLKQFPCELKKYIYYTKTNTTDEAWPQFQFIFYNSTCPQRTYGIYLFLSSLLDFNLAITFPLLYCEVFIQSISYLKSSLWSSLWFLYLHASVISLKPHEAWDHYLWVCLTPYFTLSSVRIWVYFILEITFTPTGEGHGKGIILKLWKIKPWNHVILWYKPESRNIMLRLSLQTPSLIGPSLNGFFGCSLEYIFVWFEGTFFCIAI